MISSFLEKKKKLFKLKSRVLKLLDLMAFHLLVNRVGIVNVCSAKKKKQFHKSFSSFSGTHFHCENVLSNTSEEFLLKRRESYKKAYLLSVTANVLSNPCFSISVYDIPKLWVSRGAVRWSVHSSRHQTDR